MKCSSIFLVLASILCLVGCSAYGRRWYRKPNPSERRASESSKATWRRTTIANRLFAHRLFSNIARHEESGNIIISPFVVSTGLSMVLGGAKGQTETELMKALGYSDLGRKRSGRKYTKEDVPRLYETVLNNMKRSSQRGGYMFTIASKLFADQTESFLESFLEDTERYYGARLEQLDFMHHPEECRTHINEWVSDQTHGTIPEALPSGYVTSDTLLTLVSTAYFKGEWKHKFNKDLNEPGKFTRQNGEKIDVTYMQGTFRLPYKYSYLMGCEMVILPYKSAEGGRSDYSVAMELYLPLRKENLPMMQQIGEDYFHGELRHMNILKVNLKLPKFRIDYDIDLAEPLQRLNIVTLFGNGTDLSGMNGRYNLNLETAIHKTFMEVNEEGTTAAASVALGSSRAANDVTLNFDRTFLLIIREKSTNTILFMGRIDQPE